MYLIKICPNCKTKLRFPIDKGKIKVKCACGYSFIADPDNTGIYQDASFDLSHSTCGLKKLSPFRTALAGIKFDHFIPAVITKTLEIKYKIQNFRLLPDSDKKRIIRTALIIFIVSICIFVSIYFLAHLSKTNSKIII